LRQTNLSTTHDNIGTRILDETLDEKNSFHATQMAAWQWGQTKNAALQLLRSATRRTPIVVNVLEELHPANITPNICEPVFTALTMQ
jgi:hypothetical protein